MSQTSPENIRNIAQIGYRKITHEEFATTLAAVWEHLGASVSAWLENPFREDGLCLRDADVSLEETRQWLESWPQGRVFGANGDLQWECLDKKRVHLVLISDSGVPAEYGHNALPLELLENEDVLLWGSRKGTQEWREDRLPTLRYPSAWCGPHAVIQTRIYEHRADAAKQRPYDSQIVRYVAYDGNRQ
jgi:hypothetical protein